MTRLSKFGQFIPLYGNLRYDLHKFTLRLSLKRGASETSYSIMQVILKSKLARSVVRSLLLHREKLFAQRTALQLAINIAAVC